MKTVYDIWRMDTPPFFEVVVVCDACRQKVAKCECGPEPKDCEGCGDQVEEELADEGDLCGACLTTLEEM